MRFTEHLSAHLTPEWRTQYVQYEELRDFLTKAIEEAPNENSFRQQYFDTCDLTFFGFSVTELTKINNFFEEKLAEARRKFVALKNELMCYEDQLSKRSGVLQSLQMLAGGAGERSKTRRKARRQELLHEKKQVKKLHEIKLGFSEYYLSLVLLQNYQSLNFTGFRKIMKKHDKLFSRTSGAEWMAQNVQKSLFHTNKEVDQMITKVETLYTSKLEQGDRSRAMKRLRVPPLAEKLNLWTTFRVGLLFGAFLMMALIIGLAIYFLHPLPAIWEPAMRMYRGSFIVAIFILLIGINTYGWQTAGVNHVLIFEIDPRHHLTHQEFLEISGILLIVWAASLIYFLFSPIMGSPAYAGPFFMVFFNIVYLFNPLRCLQYKARRWLLRILRRIFLAPFYPVNFADFWLADQLNSLAIVFTDCLFFLCFYSCQIDWTHGLQPLAVISENQTSGNSSAPNFYSHQRTGMDVTKVDSHGGFCATQIFGLMPFVRCLPAWFRLAQCLRRYRDMEVRAPFPHLVNAGKYSTTFMVTLLSVIRTNWCQTSSVCLAFWIITLIIATVYTYAWDILMDWGLFDNNEMKCSPRSILRDELVYRNTISYYFAILEDLVLRLSWVVDVIVIEFKIMDNEMLKCILALGEAFRRFVWNFFRLENEHLNNCGQFRAVRDIFISPIVSNPTVKRPSQLNVRATKLKQSHGGSDGGSSSGVGGSSTVGSRPGEEGASEVQTISRQKPRRQASIADTPHRYQPKGVFSSRSSLEIRTHHSESSNQAANRNASVDIKNKPEFLIGPESSGSDAGELDVDQATFHLIA